MMMMAMITTAAIAAAIGTMLVLDPPAAFSTAGWVGAAVGASVGTDVGGSVGRDVGALVGAAVGIGQAPGA